MMKRIGLVMCLLILVAGRSSTTYGSCLVPKVTEGFERAKAVFVGEVIKITPPRTASKDAPFLDRAYLVEFNIVRSWKGLAFGSLKVWTLQGDETFALPRFNKGERYLVYADPLVSDEVATDQLKMDGCNRTALLPKDAPPQAKLIGYFEVDRKNGTRDLRALDVLLILKRP